MAEFQTPIDIANRALQHCGSEMIDPSLGFNEISKRARQTSFVYGKLRRAELERNVWTFATRRTALRAITTTTMLLAPTLWGSTVTYFAGSIVNDGNGTLWISRVNNNLANTPQSSPNWEPYFGPMTVSLYDSAQSYWAGELVYTTAGDGTSRIYMSLQTGNADNPPTATPWSATTTYNTAQVVLYSSVAYMSLIDLNTNQQPNLSPAAWSAATTYSTGQKVYNPTDGLIYTSVGSGNINHDPTTDGGTHWTPGALCPWTTVFVGGAGSLKWLQVGGAEFPVGVGITTLFVSYPLGSGPSTQDNTRNAFRLPAGYLREAAQDPKAGSTTWLGAPTNSLYSDWEFEGDYIVTRDATGVIILRFVADVQDVTKMKSMFCEGLAARIGMEVCEPLTNSTAKVGTIAQLYTKVMGEARTVNAIEAGSEESPLDDYLACRA